MATEHAVSSSLPPPEAPASRSMIAVDGLSETPAVFDRDPPAIGQHTQEILATLGLDEAAVAALRAGGIV